MGHARSCKSRRASMVISHTEMQWENAIENRKCDSKVGSGLGSGSKNQ